MAILSVLHTDSRVRFLRMTVFLRMSGLVIEKMAVSINGGVHGCRFFQRYYSADCNSNR